MTNGKGPLIRAVCISLLVAAASVAVAQSPGPPPRAPQAQELIGGLVLSAEGAQVGEISAVTVGANGDITEIRMSMDSPLGLGQRIVVIPRGSYVVMRGAVVLDLSAAEVDALPSVSSGGA